MNARESLAADRDAEDIFAALVEHAPKYGKQPEQVVASALLSIAAELRAARVYANYLEGRQDAVTHRLTRTPTSKANEEPQS